MVVGLASLNRVDVDTEPQIEINTRRPWIRYWARTFDYIVWGILGSEFVPIRWWHQHFPQPVAFNIAFGMWLVFLWNFLEAWMLSRWGATPGKALFNTSVKSQAGGKLPYKQALWRSFQVWAGGIAFGLPFAQVLTQAVSYRILASTGKTLWDASGHWSVETQPLGRKRIALILILAPVFVALLVLAMALIQSMMPSAS